MKKNDKSKMVNCLGWCNKKFLSQDPTTNRICKKCSEKIKNKHSEMGKSYFSKIKVDL